MARNILKLCLGLALGAFFIWLSARDWPLDKLVGPVRAEGLTLHVGEHWSVHLGWVSANLAILSLIHVLRVVRWRPLLDPIVKLDPGSHNRIGAVSFMALFLFPLRLGELVRPYLVRAEVREKGSDVSMTEVLATVVVERVIDGLMVSLFLFFILFSLPEHPTATPKLQLGAFAALAVFSSAALLLIGARWQRQRTQRFISATAGLVSKRLASAIDGLLANFLRGLARLPSASPFIYFLALTVLYWGLNGLGVWVMLQAFELPIDFTGAYAMMACVVVGMMIPNSPGNVGSFWYFLCLPVVLYGIDDAQPRVIAFGLSVWGMQLVQQSLFGLWFVARGDVAWRGVIAATRENETSLSNV